MIRYLVVLQFPLLLVTGVLAGLEVYWISRPGREIYTAAVFLLPALHALLKRAPARVRRPAVRQALSLAGLAVAVWVYRSFHQGSWDGGSAVQAVQLVSLAMISLAASHACLGEAPRAKGALAAALAIIASIWALATLYPLIPILAAGLILGLAPLGRFEESARPERGESAARPGSARLAAGVLFLAAVDLGAVVADFQQDTVWAGHLGLALLVAAVRLLVGAHHLRRGLWGALFLVCVSLLTTAVFPDFLVHVSHSVPTGLAAGLALGYLAARHGDRGLVQGGFAWSAGLVTTLVLSQRGAVFEYRWLLILVIVALVYRERPWKRGPGGGGDSLPAAPIAPAAPVEAAASADGARGVWAAWLELAVVVLGLLADLWFLRALDSPVPSLVAEVLVLGAILSRAVRGRRRGSVRPQPLVGRWRAWGEAMAFTGAAALVIAAVGGAIREVPVDEVRDFALAWPLGDQLRLLLAGVGRALMQQLGLQCVVWAALWEISRRPWLAALLSALIFGVLHLPHPVLAASAVAAALAWVALYRRGGTLAAVVVSHLVLAAAAYTLLPERTLYDLHVGEKAVRRSANYRMLEREESREVLSSACSGRIAGSDEEYVTELFAEILGRRPMGKELTRWVARVERFSRCTAAKMLVMSDESVANARPGH